MAHPGYKHTPQACANMSSSRIGKKRGGYRKREITREEIIARFESRINKTPGHGPDGDCWVWSGMVNNKGYGSFKIRKIQEDGTSKYPLLMSHRFAYSIWVGPIPEGRIIMHRCDNPPCCNPAHLVLGSQYENLADASNKDRREKFKLTRELVYEIQERYANGGGSIRSLAREYGVGKTTIENVIKGRKCLHLGGH